LEIEFQVLDFEQIKTLKESLIGLSLATLMTSIDTNIVAVGLLTIAKALNPNFSSVQ